MLALFIILFCLFIAYTYLFFLYKKGWYKVYESKDIDHTSLQSFSIIIPARNEEDNIHDCIQSILNNNYPHSHYEIIVIDDFSEDHTAQIVKDFNLAHVKLLSLSDYLSPEERLIAFKKKALEIAIEKAHFPWIITTDADCVVDKHWLASYNYVIQENKHIQFIAAPVSFIPEGEKDTLFQFQNIDFLTMQGITAASANYNLGSMCNGANLAFTKAAYSAVDGYNGIDNIASGDDMLLMQKIKNTYPEGIYYLKNKEAIVHTFAQDSWSNLLNQRIRWASKSGAYTEWPLKYNLLIVYLFNLSFLLLLVLSFFNWRYIIAFLILLIAKTLIEYPFVKKVSQFYNKEEDTKYHILLQLYHIPYIISAGFLGLFKNYEWKGRKVK